MTACPAARDKRCAAQFPEAAEAHARAHRWQAPPRAPAALRIRARRTAAYDSGARARARLRSGRVAPPADEQPHGLAEVVARGVVVASPPARAPTGGCATARGAHPRACRRQPPPPPTARARARTATARSCPPSVHGGSAGRGLGGSAAVTRRRGGWLHCGGLAAGLRLACGCGGHAAARARPCGAALRRPFGGGSAATGRRLGGVSAVARRWLGGGSAAAAFRQPSGGLAAAL